MKETQFTAWMPRSGSRNQRILGLIRVHRSLQALTVDQFLNSQADVVSRLILKSEDPQESLQMLVSCLERNGLLHPEYSREKKRPIRESVSLLLQCHEPVWDWMLQPSNEKMKPDPKAEKMLKELVIEEWVEAFQAVIDGM